MNCPTCNVMLSAGDRTLGSCPDGHRLPAEPWQRADYSKPSACEQVSGPASIDEAPKRILWAAFAGSAYGQEITLHATEREALEACVSALGLDVEWPAADGEEIQPEEHGESRGRVDELSDDELRDHLDDYCSTRSDDWHVNEVEIP